MYIMQSIRNGNANVIMWFITSLLHSLSGSNVNLFECYFLNQNNFKLYYTDTKSTWQNGNGFD